MKNTLCIMMVLANLCFFFIGPSAASAQDHDTGKQKKITNRTEKAERPKAEKPRQAVETPGKRGKKVVIPGKDLS